MSERSVERVMRTSLDAGGDGVRAFEIILHVLEVGHIYRHFEPDHPPVWP
jgi:hypothetical protein